jgi:putative ribosome biogenesis GTPase RsgA
VEPGCALAQAVEHGSVDMRRLDAYRKLAKEIESGKKF